MKWSNEMQEDWTVEAVIKHLSHEQLVEEVTHLRAENERLRAELFHSGHHISHVEMLKDAAEADRDELLDALERLVNHTRKLHIASTLHEHHPFVLAEQALLKHGGTP